MNKIIFSDIDGVLNSNYWNDSHQREISDGTLVDAEKVKLLSMLVKRTNAKIILHSGWKYWEEIRSNKKFSLIKASEILAWLEEHEDVDSWIVIDDLDLHSREIEKHQIKTDPSIGLTIDDVYKAEKMLLGE